MKQHDFDQFAEYWTAAQEVTGGRTTDAGMAMAFKLLEAYELQQVQQAIVGHLADPERGRFAPKPADVIKQITDYMNDDGRPSADEAWSIAIQSFDENQTVVMNDEIAGSLESARLIYQDGDRTGARMAFKNAYERKIKEARSEGKPVKWWPSMGDDPHMRQGVLEQAVLDGKLSHNHVSGLLPKPITADGQKLLGNLVKQIGVIE